jgi:hypothetical protein
LGFDVGLTRGRRKSEKALYNRGNDASGRCADFRRLRSGTNDNSTNYSTTDNNGANANTNAHTYTDTNVHANANTHTDTNANTYTHANTNRDTERGGAKV